MGILKFFGNVFGVAQTLAPVAGIFFPQFMPLISMSLRAILIAEGKFTAPKSGADKQAWVIDVISVIAPEIIKDIETSTGRELADESLFTEAMKDIVNGIVKALNAFKILPKSTTQV